MTKFILAYHGNPQFKSKEDGMAHMTNWKAWMEGLGSAVLDPGMPCSASKTVAADGVSDGGGSNPLVGITIVEAADMDAAVAMAADCPHVTAGGTIEVAQSMDMQM